MNKTLIIAGLFSVAAIGGIVACSSTTTETKAADDAGTTADTGTKPKEDSGATEPTGDDICGAKATQNDCGECCFKNYQAGYQVAFEALADCACAAAGNDLDAGEDAGDAGTTAAGPCVTECAATACASPKVAPDQTCFACLNQQSTVVTCQTAIQTACSPVPECMSFIQCNQNQCANKQ